MSTEHQLTTPVGRLVAGSLYEGRDTDYDGKQLVYKSGAKAGQHRKDFSFGVAFPKTPGAAHWANEAWLAPVWQLAHSAFPNGEAQRRDFSFKIIDGDSTEMNKQLKRPCDQVGHAGHWVIYFSGAQAPRVCNADGSQIITEVGAVKKGYYVQVLGSVTDNKPSATPGLYWNHSAVALAAYGEVINSGPDISQAKFGQGVALPPGASTAPVGGLPGSPPPPPAPGIAPPAAYTPPPPAAVGVAPGPNLLPASPSVPGGIPLPNAVGAKVMSSKATSQGLTYESFNVGAPGSQWTDALLVQEGWMMPPAAVAPPAPLAPGGSVPPPPGAAPTVVAPNPAFLQMGAPPAPGAGLPPPPVATPQVTGKAPGMTYAQLIAMDGWTEALLRQEGYIL